MSPATTGAAPGAALPSFLSNVSQGGQERCTLESDPTRLTVPQRLAGLGRMSLIILALYVFISVSTGLQFYLMTWSGQHILRNLRNELRAPAPVVAGILHRA